jgi:hypothetical protein
VRQDRLKTHADAAQRAQRAWAARVAGGTWDQAAEVAGFTNTSACVRAVGNYFGTYPTPDSSEQRALWRERMELLWKIAIRDASDGKHGALRAGVAVAQRASQMDGLDAPAQVQVHGTGALAIYGGSLEQFIRDGGLPTETDRARYGITEAEISAIRQGR